MHISIFNYFTIPLKLLILLLLSYGQWMGNLSTNNLCKVIYLIASRSTFHSTLAWKIPWMEETGRLQSIGSLRAGHDWATSLSLFTFMHWRRKWQPTPVFLPGESQGRRGAWWAAIYGVAQSWTWLKWLSSSLPSNWNIVSPAFGL